MDRLNFNHLYYFYRVGIEGSIKLASEKLFVSQPTISDQIKLLEQFLDSELFERRNRSLVLTKEGEVAMEYAERIFDLSNDLTRALRHKVSVPKKSLDIGISLSMSQYFIFEKILSLFEQDDVVINFKEGERHLLLAELEEGTIEMVFCDNKDGIGKGYNSYRIGTNKTFAVAHKKFKKFGKSFPYNLGNVPYFSYTSESYLKYEIDLFFAQHDISPRVIGEADDMDLLQTITEKGLAFTIVPEVAKNRMKNNKDIIVLGELVDLQTSVWGVMKSDYDGLGSDLLKNQLAKS